MLVKHDVFNFLRVSTTFSLKERKQRSLEIWPICWLNYLETKIRPRNAWISNSNWGIHFKINKKYYILVWSVWNFRLKDEPLKWFFFPYVSLNLSSHPFVHIWHIQTYMHTPIYMYICRCTCVLIQWSVSLRGSSVRRIIPVRILEWVATSYSMGSSDVGIEPMSPALAGRLFTTDPLGEPIQMHIYVHIYICIQIHYTIKSIQQTQDNSQVFSDFINFYVTLYIFILWYFESESHMMRGKRIKQKSIKLSEFI